MILSEYGRIAQAEWERLQERFTNCALHEFQIMPDHMHGIIELIGDHAVGAGFTPAQGQRKGLPLQPGEVQPQGIIRTPNIGQIVGTYKSLVSKGCLEIFKSKNETMGKLWGRNYYEHIIRSEKSFQRIGNYIKNNPAKWAEKKSP